MSEEDEFELEPIEILELPLDAWHRDKGARMVQFAGYHMPIQYEGIMAEHIWTRDNAGLFDVSHMGQLMLTGDGVAEALEAMVPGDISALQEGKMRYSLLLAEDGGVLDDMMITAVPMGLYVVVNGAVKWDDMGYLREYLPDEITINHMEDRALLALQGPKAVHALKRVVPGVDALYFMEAGSFFWGPKTDPEPLWISRSGYTGEDGFEISVPAAHAQKLADQLCAQPEVRPIGLGARDSLRLEAGLPLYGHDMSPDVEPVEANAAFAISKRRRVEGGFAGAERILNALAKGPARKLVGLSVDGKMPVREGAPIFAGEAQVGIITSGGFAPSLGAPIAMGYVDSAHNASGTALEAEVRGKRVSVTVANLPFIPHHYHRKGANT
ncbi:glycine cleavage system aminomethyltransferase GcvT [Sphingorhabdus sp.]|uniref:glycine cleavage system aminomethyltransferase GcvT n=1 Tax=Sphingorhabdus sp. TaxID=1902408 RepID=UPI0038FCF82E